MYYLYTSLLAPAQAAKILAPMEMIVLAALVPEVAAL
jgi:hypothetical protein